MGELDKFMKAKMSEQKFDKMRHENKQAMLLAHQGCSMSEIAGHLRCTTKAARKQFRIIEEEMKER